MINDEIYHFGIKGMKWGIRRYQNENGTLTEAGKKRYGSDISKRKVKDVKNQFMTGVKKKTIDVSSINKKVLKEVNRSKEGKAKKNADESLENIFKSAESQGVPRNKVVFDKNTADTFNNITDNYQKKVQSVAKKYIDEYASISLKSLGYEDTKKGRDWLKKHNFIEW